MAYFILPSESRQKRYLKDELFTALLFWKVHQTRQEEPKLYFASLFTFLGRTKFPKPSQETVVKSDKIKTSLLMLVFVSY